MSNRNGVKAMVFKKKKTKRKERSKWGEKMNKQVKRG